MATDKKNKNKLGAKSDDDTTSELAIIRPHSEHLGDEAEADANTFAFDDEQPDGKSVAILRSDLRSRNEQIGQLQFDAEQLRARWAGLEKEISAREELTEILQQELRDAYKQRIAKDKMLQKSNRETQSLRSRIAKLEQQIVSNSSTNTEASEQPDFASASTTGTDHSSLQEQLRQTHTVVAELRTYIDGRKGDWERLGGDVETYKLSISSNEAELARLASNAADKEQSLTTATGDIERLSARLKKEQANSKQLHKKNRALMSDIDAFQSNGPFDVEKRLAEQSGQLISSRDEITELKKQILRSERYADELRERFSTLDITSTENDVMRSQLAASLTEATEQVRELKEQLDAERLINAELETAIEDLRKAFDKEARQIRFELGTAQETIGDYKLVNEQLTSDLTDHRHFRQALEDQLNATEEKSGVATSRLEKRINRLERQVNDDERKIASKDAALTALLTELANKSQTIESIGKIGSVINEIDDKMSERIEDRSGQERYRPTRLLIGMIEGQELQFPLFKERLTIGRTQQNDIQINAQYISRRHAVILCDEDGPRIIDWGSKNGILVNDVRVSEQRLRNGDKVTIGTAEFVFEERQRR